MLATIFLFVTIFGSVLSDNSTDYEDDPLVLTISPKIWDLLESKAALINAAATTISFDGFSGKESLIKYTVSGGHIEQFSIPKWGVSFYDFNNGVHVNMKNIFLRTSVHVRAEIGKKVLGKWIRIARISGDVKVKAEHANLEAVLVWKDFTFVPTGVWLNSDLRIDFTHHLRRVNFLRSKIQKQVTKAVNGRVPAMVNNMVYTELNPRLLSLKQRLTATEFLNLTNFDEQWAIQWTVRNNMLRLTLKPKNETELIAPIKPIGKMFCVDGNLRKILEFTPYKQRSKRAVPNFALSCVAPQFQCEGVSCSFCTDIDINSATSEGGDTLKQCLLKL